MMPGMPSVTRRRTPSVIRGQRKLSARPIAAHPVEQEGELENSGGEHAHACTMPAERFVAEAHEDGEDRGGHHGQVENDRDRRALHELPIEFRTPDSSATTDMHSR